MRSVLPAAFSAVLAGLVAPADPVQAQDRPHAYFVLIDTSTSMGETPKRPKVPRDWTQSKMAEVQRQLGEFCAGLPAETEVRIFTFDQEFRDGPQVTIGGDRQRDELRGFFATVRPVGNRTFAWNSLNRVLGKAADYAQATQGARVRVLMYTDGEDNDPSKPNLRKILATYKHLLKDEIQPTIVTLGFTLAEDVTDALTDAGVEHAATFEPQLPLIATLDWEPRQPTTRDEVRFIDCSLGAIVDYAWDFGDGAASSEKAPRHKYHTPGEYAVRLTIRNMKGERSSTDRKIIVGEAAQLKPSAKAFPAEVRAGEPVQFVNESQGSIAAYEWVFADGGTSSEANPQHVYEKPGTFSPTLTVVGSDDERESIELTDAVNVLPPEPPKIEFTFAPSEVMVGDAIQFFDRSSGLIEERIWDFGDGTSTSKERDPEHRFAEAGNYTVKLACRGAGGEASATASISIAARPAPAARFVVGATQPRAGDELVFSDISTGHVDHAAWDFGESGGAPLVIDYGAATDDTGRMVRHTFSKAGEYIVTLEVAGPGGSDKTEQRVTVLHRSEPPVARFNVDPEGGEAPLTVRFINRSSGMVRRYMWDFGDATPRIETATFDDVQHTFDRAGSFEVTLTAEGTEEYAPDRSSVSIQVTAPPSVLVLWLRSNLIWAGPTAIAAVVLLVLCLRWRKRAVVLKQFSKPGGQLEIRPGPPIVGQIKAFRATRDDSIDFDCSVTLPANATSGQRAAAPRGRLFVSAFDPATFSATYSVELNRGSEIVETFVIEPEKQTARQGFIFRYTA